MTKVSREKASNNLDLGNISEIISNPITYEYLRLNPIDEFEIALVSTYLIIRHIPPTPPFFLNQMMNVESIDDSRLNKNEQLNK